MKRELRLTGVLLGALVLVAGAFLACAKSSPGREMPRITWDQEKLYVDGRPYFIRGINYAGFKHDIRTMSREQLLRDIALLKDLNVNTVRLWQDPVPREHLDLLYQNGIMAIMTINNNGAYAGSHTDFRSQEQLQTYIKAAREQVRRDKGHPAILMWCAWNDGPFSQEVVDKYSQAEMEAWLGKLVAAIKEEDPGRPVTSANMPTCGYIDLGARFLDVLGFNNYAGLHGASDYTHVVTEKAFDGLVALGRKWKKPIFITETGFSTLTSPELQGKVIRSLVDAARTRTNGLCVFMFEDEWSKAGNPEVQDSHIEEYWGIVTRDRRLKSGYAALKDAYGRIKEQGALAASLEPYVKGAPPFPGGIQGRQLVENLEKPGRDVRDGKMETAAGAAEITARLSSDKTWSGRNALRIEYQARQITAWGCAILRLEQPIPARAKAVGFWIYRDGSFNTFQAKVEDGDRDPWEDYSINLGEPGWTYYTVDFSKMRRSTYGGSDKANRRFDPGTIRSIVFLLTTAASPDKSVIYIDDIDYLY